MQGRPCQGPPWGRCKGTSCLGGSLPKKCHPLPGGGLLTALTPPHTHTLQEAPCPLRPTWPSCSTTCWPGPSASPTCRAWGRAGLLGRAGHHVQASLGCALQHQRPGQGWGLQPAGTRGLGCTAGCRAWACRPCPLTPPPLLLQSTAPAPTACWVPARPPACAPPHLLGPPARAPRRPLAVGHLGALSGLEGTSRERALVGRGPECRGAGDT